MDFNKYSELAISVNKARGPIGDFTHAVLGIATEAGEIVDIEKRRFAYDKPVDVTHLKEETGDLAWYLNLLFTACGESFADALSNARDHVAKLVIVDPARTFKLAALSVARHAGRLVDVEEDRELTCDNTWGTDSALGDGHEILIELSIIISLYGLTWEEVLQGNIDKLSVRYPGLKFSNERALNRDTEAEKVALESGNAKS